MAGMKTMIGVRERGHVMKDTVVWAVLIFFAAFSQVSAEEKVSVTLMTHDSFAASRTVVEAFESANNVELKILKSGDAGAALTQAILSKNNPLADVFFGVDNTFMSRALAAGIFVPYESPMLKNIPDFLKLDPENRLLPVDFGDVCLNYDIAWFQDRKTAPPKTLSDLTRPEFKSLLVVQNPATSSPGLAFLLTTVGAFGESGYLDFWSELRKNDVYVSDGWSDAYYGQFSRAKGGTRPVVVSYASSPAAEVHFSEKKLSESPTAAVLAEKSVFRQIEFAGILKGAKHPELAKKLVDFMLGPEFQKDIPLQMWVFPADFQAPLPEVFSRFAKMAESPVALSPSAIEKGRESWIEGWTSEVLH